MSRNINAESEKDPTQLEREVDEQRAHIDDTLRALEQRFSPGRILDQVLGYARSNSGDFSRNLVDSIKTNPVPSLLTATGLLWMMAGQNQPRRGFSDDTDSGYVPSNASYGVDPAYQTGGGSSKTGAMKEKAGAMKDKGHQLREGASGAGEQARERLHQMGDSMHQTGSQSRRYLHDARDSFRERSRQASEGFSRMLREQPLAIGAMGIALGALAGASLPRTQREDELMGEQRDRLAQRASEAAEDTRQKAGDLGKRVAEDAKQEVKSTRDQPLHH